MYKSHINILKESHEKILQCWKKRAYQEISSTFGVSSLILQNSMGHFLELVTSGVEKMEQSIPLKIVLKEINIAAYAKEHGGGRTALINYSIDQLIYEYQILREVLFEVLEVNEPLINGNRDLILSMIEQSVNCAATNFADTLRAIRETFVNNVAHDLRTPITTAKMTAQLISKNSEEEYAKKMAIKIVSAMDRIDNMVADFLDASRLNAGEKLQLIFEEFDLVSLLEEIATNLRMLYGRNYILKTPNTLFGKWSRKGLQRIMENIMSNAAKYSYPNTPIYIYLESKQDNIELVVQNEADVIPEDQQKIIFQPYRRLDADKNKKGWGLGLMLSQGLAISHGGIVTMESSEKKGVILTVTLPRWKAEEKAEEQKEKAILGVFDSAVGNHPHDGH